MKMYALVDRHVVFELGLEGDSLERVVLNDLRFLVRRPVVSHPGGQGPGAAFWSSFYILLPGTTWPLSDAQLMARMWSKDLVVYEWEDTMILPILEAAPDE